MENADTGTVFYDKSKRMWILTQCTYCCYEIKTYTQPTIHFVFEKLTEAIAFMELIKVSR